MGKFTEFRLPLKSLAVGEHEFDFSLGKEFFANMECDDIKDAAIKACVDVIHKNDIYKIHMAVTGEVTLLCDRCLDELQWPIDAAYDVSVKYGDDYGGTDELVVIPESDAYLNIAYMLKDTVMLAIPMKHVHPMGKCNRAMTAMLRQHRAKAQDEEEAKLEDDLIDEMEQMEAGAATGPDNN